MEVTSMKVRSLLVGAALVMVCAIAGAAKSDEQADAFLKEVIAATQAAETLTADVTLTQKSAGKRLNCKARSN
jgi:hypothetical protein